MGHCKPASSCTTDIEAVLLDHGDLLALPLRTFAVVRADGLLAQTLDSTRFMRVCSAPWEFREEREMWTAEHQVGEKSHGSCG
jgi:hypothetical protein